MEVEINADLLTIMLLYSLPLSFENFRCAIESRDELLSPEVLKIEILEEYETRQNNLRGSVPDALFVKKFIKNPKSRKDKNYETKTTDNEKFSFK